MQLFTNGNYFLQIDNDAPKRIAIQLATDPDMELIPEIPELVDIKLTDVCFIGCSFCYQASQSDSAHGDLNKIKGVIDTLHGGITEVAFGGGDVLQHPNIVEILEYAQEKGIQSSNITVNWQSVLRYPEKLKEVAPLVTAFGISITGIGQVDRVVKSLKDSGVFKEQRNCFHIIPDLYTKENLLHMLWEIKEYAPKSDVLFLGFKSQGRGENTRYDDIRLISDQQKEAILAAFEFCKENRISLQNDTKFIRDYEDIVAQFSDELYYDITEGKFSMNIDCVENFYSIASYNLSYLGDLDKLISNGMAYAFGDIRQQNNLPKFEKEETLC